MNGRTIGVIFKLQRVVCYAMFPGLVLSAVILEDLAEVNHVHTCDWLPPRGCP